MAVSGDERRGRRRFAGRGGPRRVPVVILAGFLGAGKTTLLNHLLAGARGTRIGVVVNDFGSVNVDALSVAGQVDSMVSLENGCLCCAVDASGLDRMLSALTDPAAGLDLVVVEASGLAEPGSLVRLVLASEDPYVEYGGLVELVDAAEFPVMRARHPELAQHVATADLVVLNKVDRAADGAPELVRALAGATPVLQAEFGRIDPELLFDRVEAAPDDGPRQLTFDDLRADGGDGSEAGCGDGCGGDGFGGDGCEAGCGDGFGGGGEAGCGDHSGHAHAQYDTVTVETGPLHPRRFAAFLESRPAGLYRMKGRVTFGVPGHRDVYEVHTVGAYVRAERVAARTRGTRLVLIGAGVDADGLRAEVEACATTTAGEAVEQDLLPMLRYVAAPSRNGAGAGGAADGDPREGLDPDGDRARAGLYPEDEESSGDRVGPRDGLDPGYVPDVIDVVSFDGGAEPEPEPTGCLAHPEAFDGLVAPEDFDPER